MKERQPAYLSILIRNLGWYQATYAAGSQYTGLVLRMVIGVLSGVSATALSINFMLEFGINFILEVPAGWFADRTSRVRCALFGLFGLIICPIIYFFAVLLAQYYPNLSTALIILDGVLVGVSGPLISGSVEGFYQALIDHHAHGDRNSISQAKRSFILSAQFGKWIPTLALISAFSISIFFSKYSHFSLLIGSGFYLAAWLRILLDSRRFGEIKHEKKSSSIFIWKIKNLFTSNGGLRGSAVVKLVYYIRATPIYGYGMISIGRKYNGTPSMWPMMFAFGVGSLSIGWYLRGSLIPRLLKSYSIEAILIFFLSAFTVLSFTYYLSSAGFGLLTNALWLLLYLSIFQIVAGTLNAHATNLAMRSVEASEYSLALSMLNRPGYLYVSIFSWYFTHTGQGAPDFIQMFSICGIGGAVGVFSLGLLSTFTRTKSEAITN